jgi:hypothetical protein
MLWGFTIGFVLTMIGAALDLLRPDSVFISWTEFLGNWVTAMLVAVPGSFVGAAAVAASQRIASMRRRSTEEL